MEVYRSCGHALSSYKSRYGLRPKGGGACDRRARGGFPQNSPPRCWYGVVAPLRVVILWLIAS